MASEKQGDLILQTSNILLERKKYYKKHPDSPPPPLPGSDPRRPIKLHEYRATMAAREIIPIVELPIFEQLAQDPSIRGKQRGKMLREALAEAYDVVGTYKPSRRPLQEPVRRVPQSSETTPLQEPTSAASQQTVEEENGRQKPWVVEYTSTKATETAQRLKNDPKYRRRMLFKSGKVGYSIYRIVTGTAGPLRYIELGKTGVQAASRVLSTLAHDRAREKAREAGIDPDAIALGKTGALSSHLVSRPLRGMSAEDVKKVALTAKLLKASRSLTAAQDKVQRSEAIKIALDRASNLPIPKK